jgi:beta-N-acetylhexosaminidase
MKHFPGIGFATRNTDAAVVTIRASKARLAPGLGAYRMAIAHDIPLIMLSNATYGAYDAGNAAGWSHAVSVTLLRHDLGFRGVTITDSLDGTAHARGLSTRRLAVRAAIAGTDMILLTGSEASTRAVYATLLREAMAGSIPKSTLRASYDRILALKARLGTPIRSAAPG